MHKKDNELKNLFYFSHQCGIKEKNVFLHSRISHMLTVTQEKNNFCILLNCSHQSHHS